MAERPGRVGGVHQPGPDPRLLETVAHAPEIEEDMALSNLAPDLIGQARALYAYAGEIERSAGGDVHDEDHYAYWRDDHEFLNPLLVELPNGDFAQIIGRQFLHDAFALPYWRAMTSSTDETLAGIAAKSVKETAYHLRHSRGWVVRLGDGTDESHRRMQTAIDELSIFTGELFEMDAVDETLLAAGVAADLEALRQPWNERLRAVLSEATLAVADAGWTRRGGKQGVHSEHLGYLLAEMQFLQRAYPDASW